MLTAREYENLVNLIMNKYDYDGRAKVNISKRLKNTIAHIRISSKQITISESWFSCNGPEFAVNILKHEIAHMKVPDHSPKFKAECLRMGIRTKAMLTDEDIIKKGWNLPDRKLSCKYNLDDCKKHI